MRYFCLFLFAFINCSQKENSINNKPIVSVSVLNQNSQYEFPLYDTMKMRLHHYRKMIASSTVSRNYDSLEKFFVSVVVDSIIPYWYGTVWDFNGTTQIPRKGTIACGYFVSTVLRDAGIPLDRVRMGQAASEIMTRQLSKKNDIKIFYDVPLDTSLSFVRKKGPGLFIAGLDYHIGFLYYDGITIWFIHAKWINPKAVVKEEALRSGVLYYSKYLMIGKISNNRKLLERWIFSEESQGSR